MTRYQRLAYSGKWRIFVASTGVATVLLAFSSLLESMQQTNIRRSIRDVSPPVSDDLVMRQQTLRELASLGLNTIDTSAPNEDDGANVTSSNDDGRYSSMFTVPDSDWIRAPGEALSETSSLLKIFVYDTLPAKFTTDIIDCIKQRAGVHNASSFSSLTTKMADVAVIRLMESYPNRVYDATQADIFVVPYPHTAHCYCSPGWERGCRQVPDHDLDELFASLRYYNASTTANRHLFVLSGHQYFLHPRILRQPLRLIGGNLLLKDYYDTEDRRERGKIVIPYLNDKVVFQRIFQHSNESWWMRPRKFAFAFVFGQSNARNSNDPRKVRKIFHGDWERRKQNVLGGLPVYVRSLDNVMANDVWAAFDRYHESIFCPILAGDSCQQSRFFDVMFAGCIPVVLNFTSTDLRNKYPTSWAADYPSWYKRDGQTTVAVYPFHKGLVPHFGIDYDRCALTVPAEYQRDVKKISDAMENMIVHHRDRIRQLQLNLRECAQRTLFGMGSNAHKYNDAFAQVLRMLQYHVGGLSNQTRQTVSFK
jgi:Exostosin family